MSTKKTSGRGIIAVVDRSEGMERSEGGFPRLLLVLLFLFEEFDGHIAVLLFRLFTEKFQRESYCDTQALFIEGLRHRVYRRTAYIRIFVAIDTLLHIDHVHCPE